MGITIHFEGRLKDEAAYIRVLRTANTYADQQGWAVSQTDVSVIDRKRFRKGQRARYTGRLRGLSLRPHPYAEPLKLEFDQDLYLTDWVKTQFAPPAIHVAIVDLLRLISREFEALEVDDEGGYWVTSDRKALEESLHACQLALDDQLRARPDLEGPRHLPSGRIVDVISRK